MTLWLRPVYFSSSQEVIRDVHVTGVMYRAVEADIGNVLIFLMIFFIAFFKLI